MLDVAPAKRHGCGGCFHREVPQLQRGDQRWELRLHSGEVHGTRGRTPGGGLAPGETGPGDKKPADDALLGSDSKLANNRLMERQGERERQP